MLAVLLAGAAFAVPARADYVPGEVIVRGATPAALEQAGVTAAGTLPGGAQRVRVADGESVRETVAELERHPGVDYAVPNYRAHASAFLPNDPGTGGPGEWHLIQWNFLGPAGVNAPDAWEIARALGAPGGQGAVVAVLDSGVAYENRGRFRRAPDLYASRFVHPWDFVGNDAHPDDENGHGTHVTGTIAERTNNGIGVTGLAYGVRIMPLRVLDADGVGDSTDIARAIRYAARHGADVINMSLEFPTGDVTSASDIPEIVSAVRYAHRLGVVVVAAAGNGGDSRIAYPARTSHVISVGATTEHACRAEYSNTGSGLDIVAPGGGLDYTTLPGREADNPRDAATCQTDRTGRDVFQQTFTTSLRSFGLPDGYEGTSMAAPHVSAAAALLIATHRLGAHPSPLDVERRLEATARDLGHDGPDRRYGAGLLDVAAALAP